MARTAVRNDAGMAKRGWLESGGCVTHRTIARRRDVAGRLACRRHAIVAACAFTRNTRVIKLGAREGRCIVAG